MNACQLEYVEYVKKNVFPLTEIKDTPNPSEEYVLAQVSIEPLKYTFMLCCIFTKKKNVILPEKAIQSTPEEPKQGFYLIGKGGSCKNPKDHYLIPSYLAGAKMKQMDLDKYVMQWKKVARNYRFNNLWYQKPASRA